MCLNLENEHVQSKVAEHDIIVYKRLVEVMSPKLGNHGKNFTGIIIGKKVSGKISELDGKVVFCIDDAVFEGTYFKTIFWAFDWNCEEILVDGTTPLELITHYETPYRWFKVEIGETYTAKLRKDGPQIHEGIHSFATYKGARRDGPGVVVKCIIPKGAKYYTGLFGGEVSHASDCIKYVKPMYTTNPKESLVHHKIKLLFIKIKKHVLNIKKCKY